MRAEPCVAALQHASEGHRVETALSGRSRRPSNSVPESAPSNSHEDDQFTSKMIQEIGFCQRVLMNSF